MRSLSKEEREELLGKAGLPIEIPTDHALAMKADLSLPWNKLRIVRRYSKFSMHRQIHYHTIQPIPVHADG